MVCLLFKAQIFTHASGILSINEIVNLVALDALSLVLGHYHKYRLVVIYDRFRLAYMLESGQVREKPCIGFIL